MGRTCAVVFRSLIAQPAFLKYDFVVPEETAVPPLESHYLRHAPNVKSALSALTTPKERREYEQPIPEKH